LTQHLFVIMAQCPVSWDYTAFQIRFAWVQTRKWAWNSNNKPLESGDVISVDCGAFKTDTTVIMRILEIGEVAPKQKNYYKLLRNSCTCGNSRTRLGNRDVGNAIQNIPKPKVMV
jgi:hypothetical protein